MRRVLMLIPALAMSGLFLLADAQPCPTCPMTPGPGMGPMPGGMMQMGARPKMMRERMMKNAERQTIRGRVLKIRPARRGPGVRMTVESESRTMSVIIPPAMPLDQLNEKIERGDGIEINGVRVMRMGEPVLIAMRIRMDESGQTIRIGRRRHNGPPPMMDEGMTPPPHRPMMDEPRQQGDFPPPRRHHGRAM